MVVVTGVMLVSTGVMLVSRVLLGFYYSTDVVSDAMLGPESPPSSDADPPDLLVGRHDCAPR